MKKHSLKIIILFLLSFGLAQASYVDAEKNGYKLYRSDILKIINLASALAERKIPGAEQWEILRNAVGFFKQKPAAALRGYRILHKMLERIDAPNNSDYEYRLAVQAAYHKLEHGGWSFRKINGNRGILPIIKQYTPIYEMKTYSNEERNKFFVKHWDGLEAAKNGYYLTTFMVDSMVELAEYMANSRFTAYDKARVKKWAIADFKSNPAELTKDYAYYINVLLPQIYNINGTLPRGRYAQSASSLEKIREGQYKWFYFVGAKRSSLNLGYDLMTIIEKYNPVLVKDSRNKVLVPTSSLYVALGRYKFLEDVTGVSSKITKRMYLSEKNKMIKHFVNRPNLGKYTSNAFHSIQFRGVWAQFSNREKSSAARHMRNAYLASKSDDEIFQPIRAVLIANINAQILGNYQSNQQSIIQMFNSFNTRFARTIDSVVNSFSAFSTRQSLEIGGARIRSETDNYFSVEYEPNGFRYEIAKF